MSLRDVERVLDVFSWFYNQTKDENSLLNVMKKVDGEEFKSIKVFLKTSVPDYTIKR